jgi:surface-anchored protein
MKVKTGLALLSTEYIARPLLLASAIGLFAMAPTVHGSNYELDLHLHSEEIDPPETAADTALLPVVAAAKTTRPVSSVYDFTGVPAGGNLWLLPKNQNPSVLFLSVGTEEITPSALAGPLTWALTSVTGSGGGVAPGVFSVWNVDNFANVIPLMSTSVGAGTPNTFEVSAGTHTHFNYGFTAPGLYNVEFSVTAPVSAALGGGSAVGSATYSFGVFDTGSDYTYPESLPWSYQGQSFSVALVGNEHIDMGTGLVAVPEPSTAALTALGAFSLLGVGVGRRWRARRKEGIFSGC